MPLDRVVVHGDTQDQRVAVGLAQGQQRRALVVHGLHGVGQDQDAEAAAQAFAEDVGQIRVHEGLAPGKGDFLHRQPLGGDLVEIITDLVERDIGQPVVPGA